MHNHWKSIFFRGLVSIFLGITAISNPSVGLQIIVLIFGVYACIDGLIALMIGIKLRSIVLITEGIIGTLAGLIIFFYTPQAVIAFIFVVGVWAFATGILEIIAALELRKYISNEIWLLLGGILSVLFGGMVFINPIAAGSAISIVIGMYAIFFGALLVGLSLRLKKMFASSAKKTTKPSPKKSTKKKRK